MKHRFPILAKVIILGIGVSILTAGTAIIVSYFNQKEVAESTLINNIDNTLDEVEYLFRDSKDRFDYVSDLEDVREYVENIYREDPYHKTLEDFDTFEDFAAYYADLYPWIYPAHGLGLSLEMAEFQATYYRLTSLLTNAQISSGCVSAFLAFTDQEANFVMLSDSRINRPDPDNQFFQVPGSFYKIKTGDLIIDEKYTRHYGFMLDGHRTRFNNLFTLESEGEDLAIIATVFLEYSFDSIEAQSLNVLWKELLILGLFSLTLVTVYALSSYFLFVKNINKLSRASETIKQSLINKDLNDIVAIKMKSNDEMQILADSFVSMEKEIINYIDIVKQETIQREMINAELSVASKIQLDSLPNNNFEDDKVSLQAYIKTAKEVGGDFYDYFYLDDHRLAVLISDVSGKGIPAALFMMKGKELIKASLKDNMSLTTAINRVNNGLNMNNEELLFITSFIGVIDFDNNEIRYVNAGQEKPYILSEDKIKKLEGESNIVLGVESDYPFIEESHPFNKGDILFMFTDGLNESINGNEEEFGYERIERYLLENRNSSLKDIIKSLNDSLADFVSSKEQFDDVTMLLIKSKDNELSLHYDKKDYGIITDIVDKFNQSFNTLSEECKSKTGIIIDELVNNLISYEKREDLIIDVKFTVYKNELHINITGNGEDYNPFANHKEKYLKEFNSELEEGGFGLSIVKDLTKSYSYKYKNNHSHIDIIIDIK